MRCDEMRPGKWAQAADRVKPPGRAVTCQLQQQRAAQALRALQLPPHEAGWVAPGGHVEAADPDGQEEEEEGDRGGPATHNG